MKKMRSYLPHLIIGVLVAYQLVRVISFAAEYGGIEHDGGWMLSIARSLAERGAYTTLVSTIVDPMVPGAINVDDKFDIQAADGRIWFFTGNGIGPASIVPNAVIIKLFGTSFWALKTGPLIFYTLFLLLACTMLYRLGGLLSVLFFQAYLFFYPHMSIFLAYEAMGELPTMMYVLAAYLTFGWALNRNETLPEQAPFWQTTWRFFLAGLTVSLALNAKLIGLWSVSGLFMVAMLLWLGRKVQFVQLLALGIGSALLVLLWEVVHLIVLTGFSSFALYQRHLQQRFTFILDDGSGVGLQIHAGSDFYWDKFFLLTEVAHPDRFTTGIIFGGIFFGGLIFMWLWRRDLWKLSVVGMMWLGWLANTAWFVALAKTGWPRHFWFGLILAMMLASLVVGSALTRVSLPFRLPRTDLDRRQPLTPQGMLDVFPSVLFHTGGRLLMLFVVWGFLVQPHVWGFYLPSEVINYWQWKQLNTTYDASLPWIIIPTVAQAEVVEYITHMPAEARVYYPGQHKTAELPAQTKRIHYPLARRDKMASHPEDVVLIGPSLLSPWMKPVRRADLRRLVDTECPQPAMANEFYLICVIEAQAR